MKTFLFTLKFCFLFFVFSLITTKSYSQCGGTNFNGSISPMTTWQNVTGNSGTYAYWSFTANAGSQYEFHNCSGTAEDTYLRIYSSSWSQVHAADDQCGTNAAMQLSYGTRWTCPSSGTYYIYFTHYSCSALSSNQRMDYWSDYNPYNYDAGISAITSPATPVSPGVSTNITVKIKNWGLTTLTSAAIYYSIDNGATNTYTGGWTGSLAQGAESSAFTIGTSTFTVGTHTVRAWTGSPNGQSDQNTPNDAMTITFNCCNAPSGTFYIDITGNGDFTNFTDALNSVASCGINGPVTFIVRPGTYTGRIVIPQIIGGSGTNTVTFRGTNKSTCIVSYNATSNVGRSTIVFNGSDYITFDNLTIENTSSYYGTCFYFTGQAEYNTISNCNINVNTTYTGSYMVPIEAGSNESGIQTTGNNANYNRILNNNITGGYYGILLMGITYNGMCMGNEITGNTLTQQYYYGIYLYYERATKIKNNTIDIGTRYNSAYAIYGYYNQATIYDGNKLYPGQYGIYQYYENGYSTGDSTIIMNNIITNFKNSTYQIGIYGYYYNYNLKIYNNSILVTGSYANNYNYSAIFLYYPYYPVIKNNILQSTAGTMLLTCYYYPYGNMTIDYNDYIYPTNGQYYFFNYNTYYTNLAAWKTSIQGINSPHDVKSYDQVDPHFVSTTYPYDLHTSSNYPKLPGLLLRNVTTDVDNDPRCPYEAGLGADESSFPIPKPSARFDIDDTLCEGTPVIMMNYASAEEPKGHKWYVDGVYQGNTLNLSYTFSGVGSYVVKLITYGCGGIDSFSKTITVITPPNAPKADFITDKNVVAIYEFIQLMDLSTDCPSAWDWTIDPAFANIGGTLWPTYTYMMPTTPNSQNPLLYFETPGTYKVTLKASNGNGTDSLVKERYITVKAIKSMCMYPNVETSLYGYLTDDFDGPGYSGPITTTICDLQLATCGDSLHLNFSEFDVKSGDYLRIYDGSDNTGTPLWDKTALPKGWGNNMIISNPLFKRNLVSRTGKMYLEWERVGHGSTVNYATGGFTAEWTGYALNQKPPVASFQAPSVVCLGTPVKFQNTSVGDKMDFLWDFDAQQVNTSSAVDGEFNYDPGIYTIGNIDVVLMASNCAGSDVYTQQIYLDRPQVAPKAGFSADNLTPLAGVDEVQFTDSTTGCVEDWYWVITPSSYTFAAGTSIADQNPKVKFNDTVYYTIKQVSTYNSFSDSVIRTNYIKPVTYCSPVTVYLNPDIGMSRVKVSNLDNFSSIGDATFTDYSQTKTAVLDAQSQYVFLVERLTNFNAVNWAAWIDYNIDGDYNDPGELIFQSPAIYSNQYIDTFTVTGTARFGTTRMRVGASYNSMTNTPCGPNQYGEYEEYKVYIRPDMTAPAISLNGPGTVYMTKCQPYIDSGYTAWDNVDGNITSKVVITSNFDFLNPKVNKPGNYVIFYNVCDVQGNCAPQVQRLLVLNEEKVAPELTLLGNTIDTVEVFSTANYQDLGYIANDTCSGINTVLVSGGVDMNKVGEYSITYSASDHAGNKTTLTRTVVVNDPVMPTITLNGSASVDIEVFSNFNDPGVTITDNYCTGLLADKTGQLDVNTLGTYTITYTVTDCNGNGPVSVVRTIKVIDTTNPEIKYTGSDTLTVEVFDDYSVPAYLATDNYWTTLTTSVTGTFFQTFPTGKTNNIGFYTVIYTVTDGSGNFVSKTFVVHVVDSKKPVIVINGLSSVNLCRFEVLNAANSTYSASDNFDKTVTVTLGGSYITDYLVNFNYGFYTLTYNCTDASGNKAIEEVRHIIAKDCQLSVQEGGIEEYVKLYPNPNQGMFTVEVNKGNSASVIILNSVGQIVKEIKLQKTQMDKFNIDLSNQSDGIYMVRIMTDEGTVVKRITVAR